MFPVKQRNVTNAQSSEAYMILIVNAVCQHLSTSTAGHPNFYKFVHRKKRNILLEMNNRGRLPDLETSFFRQYESFVRKLDEDLSYPQQLIHFDCRY